MIRFVSRFTRSFDGLGLVAASVLTTLACMFLAQICVLVFYPVDLQPLILRITPIIVVISGFPLCLLVWSKVKETQKLSVELQRLLQKDLLTDAATRDFFFGYFDRGQETTGVVLMVDIDRFKAVNDDHGHLAGDAVIRAVADTLKAHVGVDDIVCRFGGEEFVVYLKDTDQTTAWAIAEGIRRAVRALDLQVEGGRIVVSVSVGGAVKTAGENVDLAIQRADDCLYVAKDMGRDRSVMDWLVDGYDRATAERPRAVKYGRRESDYPAQDALLARSGYKDRL